VDTGVDADVGLAGAAVAVGAAVGATRVAAGIGVSLLDAALDRNGSEPNASWPMRSRPTRVRANPR
jgi:hypothetical protein